MIFAFTAELRRRDVATARGPPSTPSGMDEDFREPVLVDANDDGLGERRRRELPAVHVACQVEPAAIEEQRMYPAGNSPRSKLMLLFHFTDLERQALVDPETGEALIRPGDRLAALYDRGGRLVQAVETTPGLYAVEARPIGFGLSRWRPRRNLLLVTFEERRTAAQRET